MIRSHLAEVLKPEKIIQSSGILNLRHSLLLNRRDQGLWICRIDYFHPVYYSLLPVGEFVTNSIRLKERS